MWGGADQPPFAGDGGEAPTGKPSVSEVGSDVPEHWLDGDASFGEGRGTVWTVETFKHVGSKLDRVLAAVTMVGQQLAGCQQCPSVPEGGDRRFVIGLSSELTKSPTRLHAFGSGSVWNRGLLLAPLRSILFPKGEEESVMRRLLVVCALAGSLVLAFGGSALASNHRKVSSECAAAPASAVANLQEPVGLTPDGETFPFYLFFQGLAPATGSEFRSVIATGIVLVDADGFFLGQDLTRPALNGNSGVAHCPNG